MAILRHQHSSNYTVISNASIQDKRLSWKARGMLAFLLSMPDDWEFYQEDLVKRAPDGVTAVQSGLGELRDHGYLSVHRERGDDGKFEAVVWTVYETPTTQVAHNEENPQGGKPESGGTPIQQAFGALAKTCSIDWRGCTDKVRGQLNQSAGILLNKLGATPEEILAFREWWDRYDFRGQKGDAPRPHQVRDCWGQFRDDQDISPFDPR